MSERKGQILAVWLKLKAGCCVKKKGQYRRMGGLSAATQHKRSALQRWNVLPAALCM